MAFKEYACSERATALHDAYMVELKKVLPIINCEAIPNIFTSVSGQNFLLCIEDEYEIDFLMAYSFFGKPCSPVYLEPSDTFRQYDVINVTNEISYKKVKMTYTLIGELGRNLLFIREDDALFTGTYSDAVKNGFLVKKY